MRPGTCLRISSPDRSIQPHRHESHLNDHDEVHGQVAVQRGPIVYCLESNDVPADVRLDNIVLPLDASLRPVCTEIAGARMITLEGEAIDMATAPWQGGELYREARLKRDPDDQKKVRVRLVPYYAWGNRDAGEMTVWIRTR